MSCFPSDWPMPLPFWLLNSLSILEELLGDGAKQREFQLRSREQPPPREQGVKVEGSGVVPGRACVGRGLSDPTPSTWATPDSQLTVPPSLHGEEPPSPRGSRGAPAPPLCSVLSPKMLPTSSPLLQSHRAWGGGHRRAEGGVRQGGSDIGPWPGNSWPGGEDGHL